MSQSSPRDVRVNIRLLAWFNLCSDLRFYAPVAILYFSDVAGSFALGMSVFSVFLISGALLEVPTGIFSDLIGRKNTAAAGALAMLIATVLYAIGGAYAVLVLGGIFEGLSRSLVSGNNDALLHDTLKESGDTGEFQLYLGRVSSLFQVALAIAALTGGVLASISFSLVFWLSVIPKIVMVLVALRMVEPRVHDDAIPAHPFAHLWTSLGKVWRNPRLRTLSAAQTLAMGLGEAAFQFRVVFFELLWPLWMIGAARTVSHICAAISFYFAGPLIKRFGERRLLFGGISLSELTNLAALAVPSPLSPLMMGLTSSFFGVNMVSINGMMQREFSDRERATMGSINALVGSFAGAILSVGLGALADKIGPVNALILSTLAMIVPLMLYMWVFVLPSASAETKPAVAD